MERRSLHSPLSTRMLPLDQPVAGLHGIRQRDSCAACERHVDGALESVSRQDLGTLTEFLVHVDAHHVGGARPNMHIGKTCEVTDP
eukprot:1877705-Amphidinium_carterae.1